jgi:hypothetical protein
LKTDASDSDVDITLIDDFAERYGGLCWQIETTEIKPIIRGTHGAFIYCYDEGQELLGVAFCPDELPGDGWNVACHAMIAAKMTIIRDCYSESYVAFDPKEERQSQLAISIAGIKPASNSAEQRATMCDTITRARARKAKALEHQRTMKELTLERVGCDLSDYDPTFVPGEYHLTI